MTGALDGHVAVVTGGNRGIGLGIARGLARAGASVAVWARDAERNESARVELVALGVDVVAVECDVTDAASVEAAAEETGARLGTVTALFANAGVAGSRVPFLELSLDEWRRVQQVNVEGVLLSFQAAARRMVAAGRGALVAVGSMGSEFGTPGRPHYAASKSGVHSLCRSVAVELARHGIRCNALVPGWTETEMLDGPTASDRFVENTLRRTPARRWGEPRDFEAVAAFLADPALTFHTGDEVRVDGGYRVF